MGTDSDVGFFTGFAFDPEGTDDEGSQDFDSVVVDDLYVVVVETIPEAAMPNSIFLSSHTAQLTISK